MKPLIIMPESKFLKVVCKNCKNEQVIFSKSSSEVNCLKCDEAMALSTGGDSLIEGKIVATY